MSKPSPEELSKAFLDFCEIIAALRHPQNGCPWDLQQTHESLKKYMLEEAYEAVEVMRNDAGAELCEELGDVMLQVVLNAQIAQDRGTFNVADVLQGINSKMRRRHPHVFDPSQRVDSAAEVRVKWEQIKSQEKDQSNKMRYFAECEGLFPASLQAMKIGARAKKINFDWDTPAEVAKQFRSEVDELEEALKRSNYQPDEAAKAELGDVFFSLAQLCRHLGVDAEVMAIEGNRKFLKRFAKMEDLAAKEISSYTRDELENLWRQAKLQS